MTKPLYHLEKVTKRYGERVVCQVEGLEIQRGEVFGIIGPSGAGKSTLLRLLNFLEPVSAGTIHFDGYSLNGSTRPPLELRRKVTMVFQKPLLFSGSVEDNVAYGLRIRGETAVKQRVTRALEQVGLSHLARVAASTLSGGEAQRVALARALVIEPETLLMDEPTANLDPYNVALMENVIAAVNREQGTTIILVTHNVFQAHRLAHRVMLLLDGQAVEVGETEQIYGNPSDPRTSAFIRGEMIY